MAESSLDHTERIRRLRKQVEQAEKDPELKDDPDRLVGAQEFIRKHGHGGTATGGSGSGRERSTGPG